MIGAGGAASRVVLVGAGHAHLYALKRTAEFVRRGHEVVVVAPDRFWYSGLATGMLGGHYPPELDQVDVAALVERGGGRFVADRIIGLDPVARVLRLGGAAEPLRYDALSLDLGSEPPPIPGEDDPGAYRVKPIRRLWELRRALEERLAAAPARVVIAGGGVTACELAANIAGLAERRRGRVEVTVLAGGEAVLKQLPPGAARKVVAALERRGIGFRRGLRVARLEAGRAVAESGERLPFDF